MASRVTLWAAISLSILLPDSSLRLLVRSILIDHPYVN
jgi:hypothetical protein